MNLDLKDLNFHKKILEAPVNRGFCGNWDISSDPLTFQGSFKSSEASSMRQKFKFRNFQSFVNISLDSQKVYKASLFFTPQSQASICLFTELKSDFLSNNFKNHFEILFQDSTFKCCFGVMNRFIGIYMKTCVRGLNIGAYGGFLQDFSEFKARVMAWKHWDHYSFGLTKELNGLFEGNFYWKVSESKQLAAKVTALRENVRICLGYQVRLNQQQQVRVRLDSEGLVGFEVKHKLTDWLQVCLGNDISVKSLAEENKAFMGFGVKLEDLSLFMVVKEGSPEAFRVLEKNMNWKDLRISDWTLLHLASWNGHSELCKELILLGADASAKDSVSHKKHLETPLHLAVFRQHVPTVKVLVRYSVEKNQKNVVSVKQKGQSPLDLAKSTSNLEIINLIEEWNLRSATIRNANLNVVDIN